jgi:hypothetical protein
MNPDNDRPTTVALHVVKDTITGEMTYTSYCVPGDQRPTIPLPPKPKRVEPNRFNHLEVDGFSRRNKL